jgi:hypothetical protein
MQFYLSLLTEGYVMVENARVQQLVGQLFKFYGCLDR